MVYCNRFLIFLLSIYVNEQNKFGICFFYRIFVSLFILNTNKLITKWLKI